MKSQVYKLPILCHKSIFLKMLSVKYKSQGYLILKKITEYLNDIYTRIVKDNLNKHFNNWHFHSVF